MKERYGSSSQAQTTAKILNCQILFILQSAAHRLPLKSAKHQLSLLPNITTLILQGVIANFEI